MAWRSMALPAPLGVSRRPQPPGVPRGGAGAELRALPRRNVFDHAATPSWILAPPESLRPMMGAPTSMALSMTLQIFSACASLRLPPKTVKSCEKTKTVRPWIVPCPVTTPSPAGLWASIPKSVQRWVLSMSYSRKLSSSSSSVRRSRAVSLPFLCCVSIRACPPPRKAEASASASLARTACALRRYGGSGGSPAAVHSEGAQRRCTALPLVPTSRRNMVADTERRVGMFLKRAKRGGRVSKRACLDSRS